MFKVAEHFLSNGMDSVAETNDRLAKEDAERSAYLNEICKRKCKSCGARLMEKTINAELCKSCARAVKRRLVGQVEQVSEEGPEP